jgi:hypothetical protein
MSKKDFFRLFMFVFVSLLYIRCNSVHNPVSSNQDAELTNQDVESQENNTINDTNSNTESNYIDGTQITLNGAQITVKGSGAVANGSILSINAGGTYTISGYLADGQIIVNTENKDDVILILNGTDIRSSSNTAVYIKKANKAMIILADGTVNRIFQADISLGIPLFVPMVNFILADTSEDDPNSAIYSKADLTFSGAGALALETRFADGITSKDELIFESGSYNITAADDAISGKDFILVKNGKFILNAGGDGFKSDNDSDTTLGYINILSGDIKITSSGDAISAEREINITTGIFNLTTGGGSNKTLVDSLSAKGIKAGVKTEINGGTFTFNNADDAIQSNDELIINGGTFTISTSDDAIHADSSLTIKNGNITINKCFEAIESFQITIMNGNFQITSSEDAITAETNLHIVDGEFTITSGGGSSKVTADSSSAKAIKGLKNVLIDNGICAINSADDAVHSNYFVTINGGSFTISTADDAVHGDSTVTVNDGIINITKSYEGIESKILTINDGEIHVVSSDDGLNAADGSEGGNRPGQPGQGPGQPPAAGNFFLNINGGNIVINANGDGVDINGSIYMTGGSLIIDGPTSDGNGAVDYDRTFKLTAGYLAASGSAGMALAPDNTSTQNSVLINFRSGLQANTMFHIQSSNGEDILTLVPVKRYASVAFSSAKLTRGITYDVYSGGSSTGTKTDGIYYGGTYNPGNKLTSFTVNSVVTKVTM